MCCRNSSDIKLCCACQIRFGRKISSETATPHHSHGLFKCRRTFVVSTPTTRPATRNGMLYFDNRPSPIELPIATHQRGSSDLSSRRVKYAVSTQLRQSKETYCISAPPARQKGTAAV